MRIISLLPSATEIVCALGAAGELVGVTHECDYPPEVLDRPRVTSTALPAWATSSRDIDEGINELLVQGAGIYHLDRDLIERLHPDLILTQELCDVCAVAYSEVNAVARSISSRPHVVNLEPHDLEGVLANIGEVGELIGRGAEARAYAERLRERLECVRSAAKATHTERRVYCMEWLDPPMRAGHWVPEMVHIAGGLEGFGSAGQPSTKCTWEEVRAYGPSVIVLMPCGFDLQQTIAEAAAIRLQIDQLGAAEIWAVNGSAYFSRPGPRLVDGVEILGHILGSFVGACPASSVAQLQ